MDAYYLDTSALAKLAVPEPETTALGELLATPALWITSQLGRVEMMRAAMRNGLPPADALRVLDGIVTMALTDDVYSLAGRLQPPLLRSLDAIHLAAALSLGADLTALITYDKRLADAATLNGLPVLAPTTTP